MNSLQKTVFVLGAGFSYPLKVPLQWQILPEVYKRIQYVINNVEPQFHSTGTSLIARFLNNLPGETDQASLEDVFSILDEATMFSYFSLGCDKLEVHSANESLKNYIVELILTKRKVDSKIIERYIHFFELCSRENLKRNMELISFVSLNWDNAIEVVLKNMAIHKQLSLFDCLDYKLPIRNLLDGKQVRESKLYNLGRIPLLKLHGSVNWLMCPNCSNVYTNAASNLEVFLDYIVRDTCPFCRKHCTYSDMPLLESMIITPTFYKKIEAIHLKQIWKESFEKLVQADLLVFVGYSFPYSDFHVRSLIARSVKNSARIVVILPDSEGNRESVNRYRQFFGKHRVNHIPRNTEELLQTFKGKKVFNSGLSQLGIN